MRRTLGLFLFTQVLLVGVLAPCAHAQNQAIVFIAPPGLAEDTVHSLEEAVAAQVSLVGARLVFLTAAEAEAGLEERMSQAEELAREHDAVGVFWIDARPSGRWFLYIMDRDGAHIVVRPLSNEDTSTDVAIEAAAVIAGSASDALLKQQSIEVSLGTPGRRAPEPPSSELRLEVGYAGTVFAPREPWLHGLSIGVSWLWPSGPYLGVSYVWSPPLRIVDEVNFQLMRYPVAVHGGARLNLGHGIQLGGELALGIEVRTRTTTSAIPELATRDSSSRAVTFAGLRFVGEWRITDWLGILARVSPELMLNTFDYVKELEDPEMIGPGKPGLVYLSPYELRFSAQLGVAIIR